MSECHEADRRAWIRARAAEIRAELTALLQELGEGASDDETPEEKRQQFAVIKGGRGPGPVALLAHARAYGR